MPQPCKSTFAKYSASLFKCVDSFQFCNCIEKQCSNISIYSSCVLHYLKTRENYKLKVIYAILKQKWKEEIKRKVEVREAAKERSKWTHPGSKTSSVANNASKARVDGLQGRVWRLYLLR